MAFKLDFDDIRARVSIERAAEWLGITVNAKGRGACPFCEATRDFTITPAKRMWGCWKCGKKGSVIDLVMHVRQLATIREAAQLIQEQFLGTVDSSGTVTVPRTDPEHGLKPLDYLDPEHPAVDAVGFDTEFAAKHGIGFAPKGIAKSHVLIPFRDETGTLLGYIGVQDEVWLPKEFKPVDSKIVPLKRA